MVGRVEKVADVEETGRSWDSSWSEAAFVPSPLIIADWGTFRFGFCSLCVFGCCDRWFGGSAGGTTESQTWVSPVINDICAMEEVVLLLEIFIWLGLTLFV